MGEPTTRRGESIGKDPITNPLDEKTYQTIVDNPWLGNFKGSHGFLELEPLSKPGARRGWLIYADPNTTEQKLSELIRWYNLNKETMDPIRLAAEFQRAFVAIHPYVDGNGRTSRLLMDRILAEFGLPPPILEDSTMDLYMSADEWTDAVAQGIARFQQYANEPVAPPLSRTRSPGLPGRATERLPRVASDLADFSGKEVRIGNQPFLLLSDGFLYNNYAVPHVLHEGTLYPISDRSYFLYEQGGRALSSGQRGFNSARRDVYRRHFQLLRDIEAGKVDPTRMPIIGYDTLRDVNKFGPMHLHPWQKEALAAAIRIEATETDPVQILIRSSRRQNMFETRLGRGEGYDPAAALEEASRSPTLVLAQYEKLDLLYRQYQKAAEANGFKDLVKEALESRRKIHAAARQILEPFRDEYDRLSLAAREVYNRTGRGKAFRAYYQKSKLSYASFDQARIDLPDDRIFLLRAETSGAANTIGFRSQADWRRLIEEMPYFETLRKKVAEMVPELQKPETKKKILEALSGVEETIEGKNILGALAKVLPEKVKSMLDDLDQTYGTSVSALNLALNRVLGSPYFRRGASEQFDRMIVEYALHANGSYALKEGTSFTTRIDLLLEPEATSISFTNSDVGGRVYLVWGKLDEFDWNHVSTFSNEYEVLSIKHIDDDFIVGQVDLSDLKATEVTDPKLLQEIEDRLSVPGPLSQVVPARSLRAPAAPASAAPANATPSDDPF